MRYTEEKIETLQSDDDDNIILELCLRTFENDRQVYYHKSRILKPELANKQRRVVGSLRTDDYDKAKQLAYRKHAEIDLRQKQGLNVKPVSVGAAMDKFLKNYEENIKRGMSGYSSNILRNFRKSIDIYWREYVGSKDLDDITDRDMEGYEEFRRDYAKNTKRVKNRYKQHYKDSVAPSTLKGEINYFRQFLRWCATRDYYKGGAHEWRYRTRENITNRREAFSIDQYRQLVRYMRSNKYLNKGKHSENGSPDKKVVRHRQMLRCYILFLCNTGLRIGEARNIRWGDVSSLENKLGEKVCVIELDQNLSKVSRGSTRSAKVIGRYTAWRALGRFKDFLVSIGEDPTDDRFIFSNPKGKVIQDFREGFSSVIKEAGVETDKFGVKFVPYSCRHTYITFRLKYGKNLSIHSLAKNARTSVEMIQKQYDDTETLDFVDELTL
jgi:integrase